MSALPAGWYKDPADPVTQRYWDGDGWVGSAIPADAVPPDGPPPVEEPPPPAADPATGPGPVPVQPQQFAPAAAQAPVQPHAYPPPPPGWVPPPGWTPPPGFPYPVQARPHGFQLAGMGQRFMARFIDFIAVFLLNVLVNGFLAYQWWLEVAPIFRAAMADPFGTPDQPSSRSDYLMLTMLFVATALWLAYEVPALGNSGQTLGKRIMRIKVVPVENTERLGNGRAFRRWARLGLWTPLWSCYGLGLLMQLIDSLSPLFDPKMRQALHDKTARTVVIELPPGWVEPAADAASQGSENKGER
jgi:uncharacterized RDD family membrane protein YckC